MEQVDTTITQTPKPTRRRVTIALSLNSELVRQIDEFARAEMVNRSFLWERIALSWIEQQMAEETE